MEAFWKSFAILFLAEMGDKTQIVSFALGADAPLFAVLAGIFLAVAGLMALTVGIGMGAGSLFPTFWINVIAGFLFIGFGIWALRKHKEQEEETVGKNFGPLIAVMVTFFLAELGDKTVVAGITMGSQFKEFLPVWLGSVLGMYLADVIAIVCGRVLGKRLPEKQIRYGSAFVFVAAGLYTLFEAFTHK